MRVTGEVDFWNKVNLHPTECWEWTGLKFRLGYGVARFQQKTQSAHRVAAMLAMEDFDPSLCVLHLCDNRSCVRPSHLFQGTHDDNMKDMARKGRGRNSPKRGDQVWNSKFTEDDIRTIRQRISCGDRQKDIAKDYGVNPTTISVINSRVNWGWVE